MSLTALEREFQAYVRQQGGAMPDRVVGDARADALQRLGVYADAYRLRLTEILGKDFPGVRHLAGAAPFEALAADYIAAHPSAHFNARWFGQRFPAFLETRGAALGEMARLEWAMTMVFDHADEPVAGIEAAAAIPPEHWGEMRIEPTGAQQRLAMHNNTGEIRHALDRGEIPPATQPLARPETWFTWRMGYEVYSRGLADDEAAALAAVHEGMKFAQVCEAIGEDENAALRAAALLRRWLEEGVVRELHG